jgi:4-hydroxybenzoate polyprenyltransferase
VVTTLKKATDFILYSNLFIGLCAVALAFTNLLTVQGSFEWDSTTWFVFSATVFTYSYLKFSTPQSGNSGNSHRNWAADNVQLSRNIMLLSVIATVCFFFLLSTDNKVTVLILGTFTALYGFVDIPFLKPKRKLRDYGLLKTLFVAIVWSVTTVLIPLDGVTVEPNMMFFLLLRRFLFVLALTMVFEIKDMKDDEAHGLTTIPILAGVSNTKLFAQLLLLVLMIINVVQYFFFDVALGNMLAVNLSLLASVFCIQPLSEETPSVWYYLVLDGMMVLQFIFVFVVTKYL